MERYWSLKNSYYRGLRQSFPSFTENILGEDYHQKLYISEDIFNQTELLNLHFRYTSWEIETIFDPVFIKISKTEIAAFWVQTQNVTPVTSIGTPNIIQVFTVLNVWRHFVKTTFYIQMYELLTKREVKMAKFFSCIFMDRDKVEVDTKNAKKNEANIMPSWTNRLGQQRIYHMTNRSLFSCGTNKGNS